MRQADTALAQLHILLAQGWLDPEQDMLPGDLDVYRLATHHILTQAALAAQVVMARAGLPAIQPRDLEWVAQRSADRLRSLLLERAAAGSRVTTVAPYLATLALRDLADVPDELGYNPAGLGFAEIGVEAAREIGLPLAYRWHHGFYGEPQQPDPVHLDLAGSTYPFPQAVDGRYPGDHPACTCANLPFIPI